MGGIGCNMPYRCDECLGCSGEFSMTRHATVGIILEEARARFGGIICLRWAGVGNEGGMREGKK